MIKKLLVAVVAIFVVATFGGHAGIALAASQSESTIPTSGDLCGGTGGKGRVTRVGSNSFTIAENDGSSLVVYLRGQEIIETSAGQIVLSKLKIGDRVTLAGQSNHNGTFSADTVVVCSGTATGNTLQKNATIYKNVSRKIDIATILLVGLIWLGAVIFLFSKKNKSFVYVLMFTIFYIYVCKVIDYTLVQYQSLLILKHFVPNVMLKGIPDGKSVNFIPLATLTAAAVKTSLLNIVMLVPFGFGLPFITSLRIKKVILAGALFSVGIEVIQLITGLIGHTTFRVADINDVIFNTLGVAVGYVLFIRFVNIVSSMFHGSKMSKNTLVRYITERPQVEKHTGRQIN